MGQFLGPETDIMGERYFMVQNDDDMLDDFFFTEADLKVSQD